MLEWHINADEPTVLDYNTDFKSAGQVTSLYAPDAYRASDHDPVVVGLNLAAAAPAGGAGEPVVLLLLLAGSGVFLLGRVRPESARPGAS